MNAQYHVVTAAVVGLTLASAAWAQPRLDQAGPSRSGGAVQAPTEVVSEEAYTRTLDAPLRTVRGRDGATDGGAVPGAASVKPAYDYNWLGGGGG